MAVAGEESESRRESTAVTLARMEGKLDGALATLGAHGGMIAQHGVDLARHDVDIAVLKAASLPDRIAAVEKKLWMAAGAASALGGVVGALASRLFGQ